MIKARWSIGGQPLWVILLPFFLFVVHSLLFRSWLIDDAGISFAYARNFAHGHGLVAQPGVEPVEGFSNPLWTFLISPLFLFAPADPTICIKVISCVFVLGTFAILAGITRQLFGPSWYAKATAVAASLLLAVNTSFVVWTTSGLENPLYAFLCGLYCLLIIRYATNAGKRPNLLAVGSGICAAALALTRPDGLVFLAAFPGMLAIRLPNDWPEWKTTGKRLVLFLLSGLLPLSAYAIFRFAYFGDFYPNTYHTKGGPSFLHMVGLIFLTKNYVDKTYLLFHGIFSWHAGLTLALLCFGISYLFLVGRKKSTVIFLLPLLACTWISYCLLPFDWMGEYRFATPFFLLLPLVLFSLPAEILQASSLVPRLQHYVFIVLAVLVLSQATKGYIPRSIHFANRPTVSFAGIARRMGARFNQYADELDLSEATFLTPDLGGSLYYSKHRVYDLAGLCDRKFAQFIKDEDKAALCDYVLGEIQPTFIHIHDSWSIKSGFFRDERFRKLYAPIREEVSHCAEERGIHGIYSGDYVLRSAVSSQESLERLRRKIRDENRLEQAGKIKIKPFPRG